jgi:hypothetical protein
MASARTSEQMYASRRLALTCMRTLPSMCARRSSHLNFRAARPARLAPVSHAHPA